MIEYSDTIRRVTELAEPLARSMGYDLLFLEEGTEHGQRTFRIFLDKPEDPQGINLEDCERFSRALDPILEVEARLAGAYNLEVSSPGLNRPLVKPQHFEAQIGNVVRVHTMGEIEGRRSFTGLLTKLVEQGQEINLEINVDGRNYQIPLSQVKKAHLDYFATQERTHAPAQTKNR